MKSLKKIIVIILISLALVIILMLFYIGRIAKKGLPDYNASIELPSLYQPVKVYRDSFAIPHVNAKNEHDLYMATGYLMAQDRMWQMDLLRRVTLGRLSEIFGDAMVETDYLLRSLNFMEKSEQILQQADTNVINALVAFAEGVNEYIEINNNNLPIEFTILGYKPEPWSPLHSLNLIGYMAWDLKAGWSEQVLEKIAQKVDSIHFQELLPDLNIQKSYVFNKEADQLSNLRLNELSILDDMSLDIFSGSNNWAVSGNKSVTGKPIVANDMHLGFGMPGIWIQIHQVIEGKLNVQGLALPGQPLIIVGHNDSIAWGMTNTYVDNLDFYEEKINDSDSNQYQFNNEWKNFIIKETIIQSKSGKQYKTYLRYNHRGPVISKALGVNDRTITMKWVGSEESDEMRSIYMLNRAKNWNEFRQAFTSFRSISQNVVYADTKGNIGLYCCAGVPIRKRDKIYDVLPGQSGEYDWKGMIPFDSLPFEYNPRRGYVSSANNRTIDSTYPYHIGTWYDIPYRMDRIREMIESRDKLSIMDFQVMQNDQHSKYAQLFLQTLLPLISKINDWNTTERKVLEQMTKWDFEMGIESSEAAIMEYWSYQFMIEIYKDELGEQLFEQFRSTSTITRIAINNLLQTEKSVWIDNIATKETETLGDIAASSLRKALSILIEDNSSDISTWHWGDMHQLTIVHPLAKVKILDNIFGLNRGPYRVGGSFHTVSPFKYPMFEPNGVNHGSSHRNIFDLGNWENCVSVIPTGMSGIPSSRFYGDQTKLYIKGKYHHDYFNLQNVQKNARFIMQFTP